MFKWHLITVGIILLAFMQWGLGGMWTTAVFMALLITGWLIYKWAYVRVPEMEVAVVYNSQTGAFSRFLPPGHHRIVPLVEQIHTAISTAPTSAKGRTMGVQTIGGISLNIDWSVSYSLDPFHVPAANQPKLARTLPQKSAHITEKYMNNSLQHVIGEYTIAHLCQPGSHKRLERQVRQLLASRLSSLGFNVSQIMIGTIEMPPHVKKALEKAQEQQLQMETEAHTLARMQQVISQFSEADMQRLMELERIYKMGQNGVTLVYPAVSPERDVTSKAKNSYTRFAANNAVVAPGVS